SPLMPKQQESISSSGLGSDLWGVPMQEPIAPAAENISPPNWLDMLAQPDTATRRNDPSPLTLESQSDNALSLADSSIEQLVQPSSRSSEAQNLESFISPPPSQPLPSNIGEGSTQGTHPTEEADSQPSWSKSVDAEKVEDDGESFFSPSWLK